MKEFQSTESLDFEIQTDILTLLENVKCQGSNPSSLKQALLALANICSTSTACQDYFHLTGGMEELQALLLEGRCSLLAVPAALYCLACAVRQNATTQNAVLTERMFSLIHELLSHGNSSERLIQSASFLMACAVAGSNKGQLLADESGCLQDLINLLRDYMISGYEDENTWSTIIRALGACVSNPQKSHNQQICCSLLPHALKLISTEPRHKCVAHLLTLVSSIVAYNGPNQNRIRRCGGIEVLINFLQHQMHVESRHLPLELLVNAVSAVDACIVDNEENGVEAGTLGLADLLLDLLQLKNLELSQLQVFSLTLAHVFESNNMLCKVIGAGRGYNILVHHLTEYQDEELFNIIKYILILCKTSGVHESENNQQHSQYDNGEDYTDDCDHSYREPTTSLKESLRELSSQLKSIEKISEGIQWMTNVNMTALSEKNLESDNHTPGNPSHALRMIGHHNMFGENSESLNGFERNRQGCLSPQTWNDDQEHQRLELAEPGSFACHVKRCNPSENSQKRSEGHTRGNCSIGNSVHVRSSQSVRPKDTRVKMIHFAGDNSDCEHAKDVGFCEQTKPSHSPASHQERYNPALGHAYGSAAARSQSDNSEDVNFYHGLNRHYKHMTCSSTLPNCGEKHMRNKSVHGFQIPKETRPNISSEEMSSFPCAYAQDMFQNKHQEPEMTSLHIKGKRAWQHFAEDRQPEDQKRAALCQEIQDCDVDRQMAREHFPSCLRMGSQNRETDDDDEQQCSAITRQSCSYNRKLNAAAHNTVGLAGVKTAQNSMCCERSGDGAIHLSPSTSATNNAFRYNMPRDPSSHSCVPNFCDVNIPTESSSPMELDVGTTANTCRNHHSEDLSETCTPQQAKQLHLLAQLQETMSCFFKSLIPGQANSFSKQPLPGTLVSPAPQTCREQSLGEGCLHVVQSPSPECDSLLSLCDLPDRQKPQGLIPLQTCLSDTVQILADCSNKLNGDDNNSSNVIFLPASKSFPEMQKYSIQAKPISSSCKNNCKPVEKTASDDGGTDGDNRERPRTTFTTNKTGDKDHIFVKPSQTWLSVSRTASNRTHFSNTRHAGTPSSLSASSHKLPLTAAHQPACSPALSLFDSQLKKMAHPGTAFCRTTVSHWNAISPEPNDSIREPESICAVEAGTNIALALSSSESKTDGHASENCIPKQLQSAGLYTPQLPVENTQENRPPLTDSVRPVSMRQTSSNWLQRSVCTTNTIASKKKTAIHTETRKSSTKQDIQGYSPQFSKISLCPGCGIGSNLNSCTYNIAIEASPHTCAYHRCIRQLERQYISQQLVQKRTQPVSVSERLEDIITMETAAGHDVYQFSSDSDQLTEKSSCRQSATNKQDHGKVGRRPRVSYTDQEVCNLLEGVRTMGTFWNQILCTYEFHRSRTAVDLKDKYRQLQAKQTKQVNLDLPLSLCEIRRLKNGVKHLGYNWQAILGRYKFHPGRTAADLHLTWRSLNRVG